MHYSLQLGPLKRVEAVLANSCSHRELLTTYNLVESGLVSTDSRMEDVMIGALNRKYSRPHTPKQNQNKDASAAKRVNIV